MSKLDGAIMELKALRSRAETSRLSAARVASIDAALEFLEAGARVDSARCLRALIRHWTDWNVNGNVKLDMADLFGTLEGLPREAYPWRL